MTEAEDETDQTLHVSWLSSDGANVLSTPPSVRISTKVWPALVFQLTHWVSLSWWGLLSEYWVTTFVPICKTGNDSFSITF